MCQTKPSFFISLSFAYSLIISQYLYVIVTVILQAIVVFVGSIYYHYFVCRTVSLVFQSITFQILDIRFYILIHKSLLWNEAKCLLILTRRSAALYPLPYLPPLWILSEQLQFSFPHSTPLHRVCCTVSRLFCSSCGRKNYS